MESFAFVFPEYQNERDGLARERYFPMLSQIDFIGSYFYRAGISAEPHFSTNISRTFCVTFLQQNRIDICFIEIPLFENLSRKKERVVSFLQKVKSLIIFNRLAIELSIYGFNT